MIFIHLKVHKKIKRTCILRRRDIKNKKVVKNMISTIKGDTKLDIVYGWKIERESDKQVASGPTSCNLPVNGPKQYDDHK